MYDKPMQLVPYHTTIIKVSKGAKIRNQYNQVPHLTQDTNGKVTNSQLDTTNESQEVSPLNFTNENVRTCSWFHKFSMKLYYAFTISIYN